jgi:hypothetical protein
MQYALRGMTGECKDSCWFDCRFLLAGAYGSVRGHFY